MTRTPVCVACEGTVAPDGHCWDCGADQPDHRVRMEAIGARGAAGVSDRGSRRGINADALALAAPGEWTAGVVCDGVSMSPRAERAAQLAAETGCAALAERLVGGDLPETALSRSAARAGRAVEALSGTGSPAPACTYVAGAVGPEGLWVAWIGDSRAYWLADPPDQSQRLTTDDSLAAQLAVSVQNARLHERATTLGAELEEVLGLERQAARQLGSLYEISRSFAQSLSLEATLEAVVTTVVELLQVDAAVIRLRDARGETLVPRALHVADDRLAPALRSVISQPQPLDGLPRRRLRTGRAVVLDAQTAARLESHRPLRPFLERGSTAVVLPIATSSELLGTGLFVSVLGKDFSDRRNEPIPMLRNRGYKSRLNGIVTESPPQP